MASIEINRDSTAVLIMDYQVDVVRRNVTEGSDLLDKAAAVLKAARKAGIPVIYIVVSFRPGHPEVSSRNKMMSVVKNIGGFLEGSADVAIHPKVAPTQEDVIVTKKRVGAFYNTELETILRSQEVTSLILLGLATSGVVLSTLRWAVDADYTALVVEDCCSDPDEEVHRVLTEKVFRRQATVVSSHDVIQAIS